MAVLVALLCAPFAAAQTTYYVDNTDPLADDDNDGSQGAAWLTIGRCDEVLTAGDTCLVRSGGTYDERVTVTESGVPGASIVYLAEAGDPRPRVRAFTLEGDYIRIAGFDITNFGMAPDTGRSVVFTSRDGIEIIDNVIHDTSSSALWAMDFSAGFDRAQDCVIRGNTIARIGPESDRGVAVSVTADRCLLENNDVSRFEDAFRLFGVENVLRDNVVHDALEAEQDGAHPDAFQSFCNGAPVGNVAVNSLLIEGHCVENLEGTHGHGFLINATDGCGGSSTVIVRYNSFQSMGSGIYYADDNSAFGNHHQFYGNTVVNAALATTGHIAMTFAGIDAAGVFNNILVDAISDSPPYSGYRLRSDSDSVGDYNLAFMSGGPRAWSDPIGSEPHAVLDLDPAFLAGSSCDFALAPDSPARDAGGPLTTVAAADDGSGLSLVVEDAHRFQPGWAGTEADWIAVGDVGEVAQIDAIDYGTDTITLRTAVFRQDGDPVWLYRDSRGTVRLEGAAPDIGAFEFSICGLGGCEGIFGDRFESGDTSAWSSPIP